MRLYRYLDSLLIFAEANGGNPYDSQPIVCHGASGELSAVDCKDDPVMAAKPFVAGWLSSLLLGGVVANHF